MSLYHRRTFRLPHAMNTLLVLLVAPVLLCLAWPTMAAAIQRRPVNPQSTEAFPGTLHDFFMQYKGRDIGNGFTVTQVGADFVCVVSSNSGNLVIPFTAIQRIQLTGEATISIK